MPQACHQVPCCFSRSHCFVPQLVYLGQNIQRYRTVRMHDQNETGSPSESIAISLSRGNVPVEDQKSRPSSLNLLENSCLNNHPSHIVHHSTSEYGIHSQQHHSLAAREDSTEGRGTSGWTTSQYAAPFHPFLELMFRCRN